MRIFQIVLLLCFLSCQAFGQINGNKKMDTIIKSVKNLTSIDIQFNAKIILDYTLSEELKITADKNVLEYIGINFEDGKLTLDQIKWIEPSVLPIITIGTPLLNSVYQGTHSKTTIKNINGENLLLAGNVGKINAAGKIENLTINTTGTDMDLSSLQIENAFVSIDDDSEVIFDEVNQLKTDITEKARLIFLTEQKNIPLSNINKNTTESKEYSDLKWIDFQIKNNSWNRNHFVVVGPKKDGSKFSYGFSMLPNFTKKEKWSVGTKIFKVTKFGGRKLLVTISKEDEDSTVALFN